jgi:hypothetical protein
MRDRSSSFEEISVDFFELLAFLGYDLSSQDRILRRIPCEWAGDFRIAVFRMSEFT